MKVIAYTDVDKYPQERWIYTVEIRENRVVDVMINSKSGLCYIMQNHDGSTVFDPRTCKTYPGYSYNQEDVINHVSDVYWNKSAKQKESEKLQMVCNKVSADIKRLGRKGYAYGPCCKKGVVCSCGKLSSNPESADCKWCFYNDLT